MSAMASSSMAAINFSISSCVSSISATTTKIRLKKFQHFQRINQRCRAASSVVDPNSFFPDSDPQIIFFGFGYGFGFLSTYFDPKFF
jgi:hypothetical protein